MVITETGRGFEVQFNFDTQIISAIKSISGSKYFGPTKGWLIPLRERKSVEQLHARFGSPVANGALAPERVFEIPDLPELTIDIPLKRTPFHYQKKGIARMIELKRCINGDEPGLGKTGQSIASVVALNAFPCLVICPATLKENWRREWSDLWTDKKALILTDKHVSTWPQYWHMGLADVFIVNYESLMKYFVSRVDIPKGKKLKLEYMTFHPAVEMIKSVIVDESHRCKDPSTRQSKVVAGICMSKEVAFLLTGTPVVNKPKDLISQLFIINRMKDFGGGKFFKDRYCEGGNGSSNLRELNGRLNQICFFRREKKEVLQDLPEKMREVVYCDITTRQEYDKAERNFKNYLIEKGYTGGEIDKKLAAEVMVQMQMLRNISARGKLREVTEHIQEVVDSGEKIIVFFNLREIASELLRAFPEAVTVRGADDLNTRNININRFQNDPSCQLIFCSIKAAGTGITLTASSRVLFIEDPWHAADKDQCEARAHRIGQKNAVQITTFLGKNTIDEDVYQLIEQKRTVSYTIMGASDDTAVMIRDLTKNLFNQKK